MVGSNQKEGLQFLWFDPTIYAGRDKVADKFRNLFPENSGRPPARNSHQLPPRTTDFGKCRPFLKTPIILSVCGLQAEVHAVTRRPLQVVSTELTWAIPDVPRL